MKKAATLTVLVAAMLALFSCEKDSNDYNYKTKESSDIETDSRQKVGPIEAQNNLEFPALKQSGCVVIVHKAVLNDKTKEQGINYSVEWDINQRTQHWSCYKLYKTVNYSTGNNVTRYKASNDGSLSSTCQYPNDPDLPLQYRLTTDPYKVSGYDHGHICPSADRQRSTAANYQTFYITNMQPQYKNFNGSNDESSINERSPWFRLENRTRTWANQSDTLYVCKGGVVGSTPKYIGSGSNRIPVPDYFFVALLSKKGSSYKAIGFWMKHESSYASQAPLSNYAVSISELEDKTGLDFFCNLTDSKEREVENVDEAKMLKDWSIQ